MARMIPSCLTSAATGGAGLVTKRSLVCSPLPEPEAPSRQHIKSTESKAHSFRVMPSSVEEWKEWAGRPLDDCIEEHMTSMDDTDRWCVIVLDAGASVWVTQLDDIARSGDVHTAKTTQPFPCRSPLSLSWQVCSGRSGLHGATPRARRLCACLGYQLHATHLRMWPFQPLCFTAWPPCFICVTCSCQPVLPRVLSISASEKGVSR
jgi:hypothetical protein